MAIAEILVKRPLLGFVCVVMPVIALGQSDCIFRDSFACGPDVKGPTIRIIAPESWVTDRTVVIEFEDESGLAGYATKGLQGFGDWKLFWEHPQTAIKEYTLSNLGDLLATGAEIKVVAQDIHGNFSRKSAVFTANSAITPGTYTLSEPLVSETFDTENCSSFPEALPFQYEVDSIDVAITVSSWFQEHGCRSGEPCIIVTAGSFISRDVDDNIDASIVGSGGGLLQNFETDLEFSGLPSVQSKWGGSSGSGSTGSSVTAVFTETTPQEITAEVTFYCANRWLDSFENGCPEYDPDCVIETYSFTVQGQLNPD